MPTTLEDYCISAAHLRRTSDDVQFDLDEDFIDDVGDEEDAIETIDSNDDSGQAES